MGSKQIQIQGNYFNQQETGFIDKIYSHNKPRTYAELAPLKNIDPKKIGYLKSFFTIIKSILDSYSLLLFSLSTKSSKLKPLPKNNAGWQKKLTTEQYAILRRKGTEAPFSGKYLHETKDGVYSCAACGNPLFLANNKFDSNTGWPSFDKEIPENIKLIPDHSLGLERTEVVCSRCRSHLGHVFNDGPTKTGKRFCLNSISLNLEEK